MAVLSGAAFALSLGAVVMRGPGGWGGFRGVAGDLGGSGQWSLGRGGDSFVIATGLPTGLTGPGAMEQLGGPPATYLPARHLFARQ